MLYDIEDSEADDQLIPISTGTMRKKDIHEGKEYELDESSPRVDAVVANGAKSRRRK